MKSLEAITVGCEPLEVLFPWLTTKVMEQEPYVEEPVNGRAWGESGTYAV